VVACSRLLSSLLLLLVVVVALLGNEWPDVGL
jgi:hypothetical protein